MIHHQDIAAALGKTLWTTDLFMPQYRPGEIGVGKIDPGGQLITDWGTIPDHVWWPCSLDKGHGGHVLSVRECAIIRFSET